MLNEFYSKDRRTLLPPFEMLYPEKNVLIRNNYLTFHVFCLQILAQKMKRGLGRVFKIKNETNLKPARL